MSEALKKTRLHEWHQTNGGRMVPFAGWEMPVQYQTGPIEEHHITRRSAGLFDIDHMGQFTVSGPDALPYLNRLTTYDITGVDVGQAQYSLMLYEHGGVVDDVFIYRIADDKWFVVVNAANRDKDFAWMQQHLAELNAELNDVSSDLYMVALQGPNAIVLLDNIAEADISNMPRFSMLNTKILGVETMVGRTGYTGEDGVELFFPSEQAINMWQGILDAGSENSIEIAPIGLGARDSLRFEPCFALYGHEITEDITPLEANLKWACKLEHDFIGRDALLEQRERGLGKKLIGFELTERGVPREGYLVANTDGEIIGQVVTGMYAPTIDKYAGHAFVPPEYAKVGTEIAIMIRNKPKSAQVIKRPFYKPAYR